MRNLKMFCISLEPNHYNFIKELGYIPVGLGEIKFSEQVDLFYHADYIVGLHGAGFANLVFCKPGTKVIEFRSSTAGQAIENLAKKNNLNYNSIITEAKHIYKYNIPTAQGHLKISISSLSKVLEN